MVKTIYDPQYRRLIGKLKQIRLEKGFRQVDAAKQLHRSRKWLGKIESHELRLDVLCFIRLCQAYGIKASRLIREMEEEPSEDDGSFLGIEIYFGDKSGTTSASKTAYFDIFSVFGSVS